MEHSSQDGVISVNDSKSNEFHNCKKQILMSWTNRISWCECYANKRETFGRTRILDDVKQFV